MQGFLGKFQGLIYAAMRIMVGLMFAQHGAQKLFGWFGEDREPAAFLSLMFFAGLIEFFGGMFVALGFQASWAAFIASGQMAVAYFWRHAPGGFFPIENRGESAVIFSFIFLYIAAHGAGKLSIDSLFRKPDKT